MSRTRDFSKLINGFAADKIISGTLDAARLANIDSDYVQLRQASADLSTIDSDYIQLRQATADLTNLNADNLTSGTIPSARVSSGAVTQHVSAVSNTSGSWTPSPSNGGFSGASGRYIRVGNFCLATGHARFSSRTTDNGTQFFINGLPFTAKNSGDAQGSGTVSFRGATTTNVVIKANESRIRIYSNAFDLFTTSATAAGGSNEYFSGFLSNENKMLTNRNLRQSSNNDSTDNVYICVFYGIA